jgi:hypothetical protein
MDAERPPQMQRKSAGNAEPTAPQPYDPRATAFGSVFLDACRKCFAAECSAPLTESESHRLSVDIAEATGLEIGWKTLKNYSHYLFGSSSRVENPSVPTLDTLARYVAGAPRTDDERRRRHERHYPYWVRYREGLRQGEPAAIDEGHDERTGENPEKGRSQDDLDGGLEPIDRRSARRAPATRFAAVAAIAVAILAVVLLLRASASRAGAHRANFTDEFDDVSAAALAARGWTVLSLDSAHWARRGAEPRHLTLFTLQGDNWPQAGRAPDIRNLLVRPLPSECFVVDARFTSFVPTANWQQAGILVLEDTALAGRSVRLSIGFNDFSGGFPQTREIIVQGITSLGRGADKPEEIVHHRLFVIDSATEPLVRRNLESSALRIEKRGSHLRLLYSAGPMKNGAFKEVSTATFEFRPAYVALFALKGFVSQASDLPVRIDAFGQSELPCTP